MQRGCARDESQPTNTCEAFKWRRVNSVAATPNNLYFSDGPPEMTECLLSAMASRWLGRTDPTVFVADSRASVAITHQRRVGNS
jgi:hypothetical protein